MGILKNQSNFSRHAECGCVVKIEAKMLLEGEELEALRCEEVCGIISNLEEVCNRTIKCLPDQLEYRSSIHW